MECFAQFLELHARKQPNKTAVICGDKRISYGLLNARADALARAFRAKGLKRGDKAALLLHNGNEIVECVFACAKLGLVSVPLNFRLVGREFSYILNDCEASLLVYGQEFEEVLAPIRSELPGIKSFVLVGSAGRMEDVLSYEGLIETYSGPVIQCDGIGLDDDSSIIYTSGTTGRPKGVVRSHRANLWAPLNQVMAMGHRAEDIEMYVVPLFNVSFFNYFMPNIVIGSTVLIFRNFDPEEVVLSMQKERVSRIFLVPTMWNQVMTRLESKKRDVSSLRVASSGAESCAYTTKKRILDYFEGIEMWEAYGLSEGGVTLLPPGEALRKIGSVGKPSATNEARIVRDGGEDASAGEIGEVVFRGPSIMKEYYRNPEGTMEALRDGWLHTGDLARLDEEGFIYIMDRKKDMIISGGENIYPREIEEVLFSHPAIVEAAVIGVPDDRWGESVKAVVVLREGQHMSAEEVISFCKENLASYKKPKRVEFMDALPRNPSGKVLKTDLRPKYTDGKAL